MDIKQLFRSYFNEMPLVAILRGIKPQDATKVAKTLINTGFKLIEIPLNSPVNPLDSIQKMVEKDGDNCLFGAGTVIEINSIESIQKAGGKLIISPNFNEAIVRETKRRNLISIPGVATPTEALAALEAGADALKLFPGELVTPQVLKAIKVVLPAETLLLPVGGVNSSNMAEYMEKGASGFGCGSNLYSPGSTIEQIADKGRLLVDTINGIRKK